MAGIRDFQFQKPPHPAYNDRDLDGVTNRGGIAKGGFWPVGVLRRESLRPPKDDPSVVSIEAVNDNIEIDAEGGAVITIQDDGSAIFDFGPQDYEPTRESKFNDNLAEKLNSSILSGISMRCLDGIQMDEMSRQEWLTTRAEGLRILGVKIEGPRTSIDTTAALEGMSNVRHPLLLEAVNNFWANASGEMLPAAGPVKIDDKLKETGESNKLAEQLEEDFNYYLTTVATEYYPDMSRGLYSLGFGGLIVKKVYNCPLRQRPVSECIDAVDLIVSNAATDLRNSGRYTHQIKMRPSVLRRMQLAGAYRDVPLITPSGVVPNAVEQQIASMQGVSIQNQKDEDREHTIYECYTELDIPGYEDKGENGEPTGLALPYRVVIDKDSTQVLEVRRNWAEDDETKTAKLAFVVYTLLPGFGFYALGLLNILGNTANAMTAAWRETLDAGMFANFPGFLYAKIFGRQNSNEIRVPPGGGYGLEVEGGDISKAVMPLPYKDVSTAFVGFQDKVVEQGQRLGGVAQIAVAEGKQDAPVGTTLAMLEQATKVEKAVHKEMWRSQAQELLLLKDCFRENPESFIQAIRKRGVTDWDEDGFIAALNDASLVPQADPNTPSHMHRLIKAQGLVQVDKAYPGVLDPIAIVDRVVTTLGYGDFNALRNKNPQPGGIPPELMVELKRLEMEGQKLADKSTDREFKLRMQVMTGRLKMMELQAQQAENEHQLRLEQMQAEQGQLQHSTDLRQSELDLTSQHVEAQSDVRVEEIRREIAEIEGSHTVKAEEVKAKAADTAGQHATRLEEARESTEDTKGRHATAAARAKPKPKPAAKK